MRLLVYVFVALVLAALATELALEDPGYLLLARTPWVIEMPLTVAVVLLGLAFVAIQLTWGLLSRARRTPRAVAQWQRDRARERLTRVSAEGYLSLVEGEWTKAERSLEVTLGHRGVPLLNYLAAAYAAEENGRRDKRDEYLRKADEIGSGNPVAIGLTRARLALHAGEMADARQTLEGLRALAPRNDRVVRLLLEIYRDQADWSPLIDLLPQARKIKALPASEADALERSSWRALLQQSHEGEATVPASTALWAKLPASLRKDVEFVAIQARRLSALGAADEAETLLRAALKRGWSAELAYIYGLTPSSNISEQLAQAERWLDDHGSDGDLLLTLGRLAAHNHLWGKARSYLESAVAVGARAEASRELGQLLEQLGERDGALASYRRGLEALTPVPIAELPHAAPQHRVRVVQ